jgi:hypothetical protein
MAEHSAVTGITHWLVNVFVATWHLDTESGVYFPLTGESYLRPYAKGVPSVPAFFDVRRAIGLPYYTCPDACRRFAGTCEPPETAVTAEEVAAIRAGLARQRETARPVHWPYPRRTLRRA